MKAPVCRPANDGLSQIWSNSSYRPARLAP
jgi:hypothetical protein